MTINFSHVISVNLGQRIKTSMYNHTTRYCRERDQEGKTGDKEKDMKSPICGKNTKGVKVFKCTYCNFSGGSSGVVYSHMNKEHGMGEICLQLLPFRDW